MFGNCDAYTTGDGQLWVAPFRKPIGTRDQKTEEVSDGCVPNIHSG